MIAMVVSGGQTGVDRAALDVALEVGLPCGGWCPQDRQAEDGPLDARYPLKETPLRDYAQRTEWNVRDSDGTLILHQGELTGGTAQTADIAVRLGKPSLALDLTMAPDVSAVLAWVKVHGIRVLNVAGPRESKTSGVYLQASAFLHRLFVSCRSWEPPT